MNCAAWEEQIAGQIGSEFSEAVRGHLASCASCAALAEELKGDRLALQSPPRAASDAEFVAVRRSIRAAIVRRRRIQRYAPALAAAAAIAAFVLFHQGVGPAAFVSAAAKRGAAAGVSGAAIHKAKPRSIESVDVLAPGTAAPGTVRRIAAAGIHHAGRRRRAQIPVVDLALLRRASGLNALPESGSDSPVEMQIATANPNVTIILLQAKEGSYE